MNESKLPLGDRLRKTAADDRTLVERANEYFHGHQERAGWYNAVIKGKYQDRGDYHPTLERCAMLEEAAEALERVEQPEDASSDLRERILDEIEDPADCEHGHPSCAKCLYERREGLLREAADSLNRTEQANSDVLRAALKDKDDEIVRLEDMLSSRRDVTMERCDKCHRLYPIVDMVKYGDPDDVDAWHYLCAPCDYAEVKTHG